MLKVISKKIKSFEKPKPLEILVELIKAAEEQHTRKIVHKCHSSQKLEPWYASIIKGSKNFFMGVSSVWKKQVLIKA
ncbi:hypothetical protein L1077_22865 [Pseudoalteromonas luteoviolacea]|uniref:hypothetical protein n=1 Tax=Pseudoalteromonas luteoviolacea TaxID=43657 RepID=UPI001F28D97C|nr:hypothetical protein [Pseudoalteromonas luteoviolacea]MCF6442271.1 hypothetical protein [Pseudoalteromonas luteoviolacea]